MRPLWVCDGCGDEVEADEEPPFRCMICGGRFVEGGESS